MTIENFERWLISVANTSFAAIMVNRIFSYEKRYPVVCSLLRSKNRSATFNAIFPPALTVLIGEHRSGKRFLRFLERGCGNWANCPFLNQKNDGR